MYSWLPRDGSLRQSGARGAGKQRQVSRESTPGWVTKTVRGYRGGVFYIAIGMGNLMESFDVT